MGEKIKQKVLIVDDNSDHCEILKHCLQENYDIDIALGGEEAIAKIYNFEPVLILLDIMMPRLTGDELVKMIKAWKPNIQVIMVSAHLIPEVKEECMQNGAFDCICKPVDFELVRQTVIRALKQ
jgi:CheY-like chemotaxis protein